MPTTITNSGPLDLFVPGRPAPQGSKRHVGNGILVESSKALAPWRTTVAWHAAQAFRGAPLNGPLMVRVEFVMPRPASLPKRKPTPPHTKRPDTDKLIRSVLDALTGVVWRDDSQIVDLHPTKRYAELDETPGAHIRVNQPMGSDPSTGPIDSSAPVVTRPPDPSIPALRNTHRAP